MSGKVSGLVLDHLPGNDHVRLVIALVLADAADHDGRNVRPSVARVARLARVAERTVQYQLRQFERDGFLVLVRPGGGRGRPAEYSIDLGWLRVQPAILDISIKGASAAPFMEMVQKGCTSAPPNGAKRVQPRVHPTHDPSGIPTTTHHRVAVGEIDEFVEAAAWEAGSSVRSPSGFRSRVRSRIETEGASADDAATLARWRAWRDQQQREVSAAEREKRAAAAQKKANDQKRHVIESFLGALDAQGRADIDRQFGDWLASHNQHHVLITFRRVGITESPMVFALFVEFFDHHHQETAI